MHVSSDEGMAAGSGTSLVLDTDGYRICILRVTIGGYRITAWYWPHGLTSLDRPRGLAGVHRSGHDLFPRINKKRLNMRRILICPSVCRRHGFRSISQVCFGISISNFICMLMVAIGRSLLIFSDVTFKMAAWRPYWIFWFPDYLYLGFEYQLQTSYPYTYVYG